MLQPLTVPASICTKAGFGSSSLSGILNARRGANMAARGAESGARGFSVARTAGRKLVTRAQQLITDAQPFGRIGVTRARPVGPAAAEHEEFR
jgi:hypothetical protein